MTKEIITGTKITFKETGDKFTLTQTDTGFDLRQVKLSKNVPAESYTFQELLNLYELGQITIEGFEETDRGLVHSIITNYIYQTNLKEKIKEIESLQLQISELTSKNAELSTQNTELIGKNKELNEAILAMDEK